MSWFLLFRTLLLKSCLAVLAVMVALLCGYAVFWRSRIWARGRAQYDLRGRAQYDLRRRTQDILRRRSGFGLFGIIVVATGIVLAVMRGGGKGKDDASSGSSLMGNGGRVDAPLSSEGLPGCLSNGVADSLLVSDDSLTSDAASGLRFDRIAVATNRIDFAASWLPGMEIGLLALYRSPTLQPPAWAMSDYWMEFSGPTNHVWSIPRDSGGDRQDVGFFALQGHGLLADPDRDGVPTARERELGTNPLRANSDGDRLSDGEEVGMVEILDGDDFLWLDASRGFTLFTPGATEGIDNSQLWGGRHQLGSRSVLGASATVDGFLNLHTASSGGYGQVSSWSPTNDLRTTDFSCGGFTVMALAADLSLRPAWGSRVCNDLIEIEDRAYDVFEWVNVGFESADGVAHLATFEIIIAHDEPDAVYVSYLSVDPAFPLADMRLGVQDASQSSACSPGEFYTVSCPVSGGLDRRTFRYVIGRNTDPTQTDPDWAIIGQGADWVRATFANADEINAVGYANWVDSWVGAEEPNGRWKLVVSVTNDPPALTGIDVGPYHVMIDEACELVFPLEVHTVYPLAVDPDFADLSFSWDDGLTCSQATGELQLSLPGAARSATSGSVALRPLLVTEPNVVPVDRAEGTTLNALWNVADADYAWRDDGGEAEFSSPNSPSTVLTRLAEATTLSVTASDGRHSETGRVSVTGTGTLVPESQRTDATLGWTTGTNSFGTAMAPDALRPFWAAVVGNEGSGARVRRDWTVAIPQGRTVFAGVFASSSEYPEWTSRGSQYNDGLYWSVGAEGSPTLEGLRRVNELDAAFGASLENAMQNVSPAALVDGGFYSAPSNAAAQITVTLVAWNVGDGNRPSGIALGLFPVAVNQLNHPLTTGECQTTDSGAGVTNAVIASEGVAYITGEPAVPQLFARINGLPSWLSTTWSGRLTTERGNYRPDDIDTRIVTNTLTRGSRPLDIAAALTNEVIGGRFALTARVGGYAPATVPFAIRGKNPSDAVVSNYLDSVVDPQFRSFAWMIAKHESKTWAPNGQRVYNQFNPRSGLKEMPFKGTDTVDSTGNVVTNYGWGVCQIDKGPTGLDTRVIYDWHSNVSEMNAKLNDSFVTHERFLGYFRDLYQNDSRWREPDGVTTNLNGRAVSLREWSILTFYNGSGGCPRMLLDGVPRRTPFAFDPASARWILYPNSKRYPVVVNDDRTLEEME